jgi:hypothetical protein
MYYNMDWEIEVGAYKLLLLDSVEVHKSVDLLADTCTIKLPAAQYGRAYEIEDQIKRGDEVVVRLGYDGKLVEEFRGFLLSIGTDDGSLTLNCEDALFLLRKPLADKEMKGKNVKEIAQYLLDQAGGQMELSCDLGITYDKFVISKASAYDVLKKLQEDTLANIYLRWLADKQQWELNIHPLYSEKLGDVSYSFQQNIESSSLKYVRAQDKKVKITITTTGKDGREVTAEYGTTGGEEKREKRDGMSKASMMTLAKSMHDELCIDGYEGDITGWLIPYVEPTYSASIKDEDYEYKDGTYYVSSVTTTFDSSGGVRKVQLSKRLV